MYELKNNTIKYELNSQEITYLCKKDEQLQKVINYFGPLEYELYADPYIFLIKTIIGQMLSKNVANIMTTRFLELCHGDINPHYVQNLEISELRKIGLSNTKAQSIKELSKTVALYPTMFEEFDKLSDEEIIHILTQVKGVGNWSAKMFLIFYLNRLDVLPHEDAAFLSSFRWLYGIEDKNRNHPLVKEYCSIWKPYSSLAARYLYLLLDSGATKNNAFKLQWCGGEETK